MLSASGRLEYLVSVHVGQAELVIHDHGGNELRSQLALPEGNGGVAVRLRLTTDIAVLMRTNLPGEQFQFVMSSRKHIELLAPIEWAGTSIEKSLVPEDVEIDTARDRDTPRLTWVDYPFGELHEQLWSHLETTQRVHRVVPVLTWPDEYHARADQVSLHADFDQQDFIEVQVASLLFPNRAAGSAVGGTPGDLLRAAVARILTEILAAPRIIADTLGPGGAGMWRQDDCCT